jgi:hypothetical protein
MFHLAGRINHHGSAILSHSIQQSKPARRVKPRMAMRGPDCYRAAKPRRLLFFDRVVIIAQKTKYNGEVSLRDRALDPRTAFGRESRTGDQLTRAS